MKGWRDEVIKGIFGVGLGGWAGVEDQHGDWVVVLESLESSALRVCFRATKLPLVLGCGRSEPELCYVDLENPGADRTVGPGWIRGGDLQRWK